MNQDVNPTISQLFWMGLLAGLLVLVALGVPLLAHHIQIYPADLSPSWEAVANNTTMTPW